MEKMKNIAFLAMGAAAAMVYQKYNEPMKKAVKKAMDMEMSMAKDALEDMM